MEGKHEEFWNQGDFGYVKKEVDSIMTLCKPQTKVTAYQCYCVYKPINHIHAQGGVYMYVY